MLEINKPLLNALRTALLAVSLIDGLDSVNVAFSQEKTIQVAKYLQEELKGTGPYLINGVSINPDNLENILDSMDELYKAYSIAITYSFPDYIAKVASTQAYQLGPLGALNRKLSEFDAFYKEKEELQNGAIVAVILVLNPIDPSSLANLKSILAKHSVVYAFKPNSTGRPNFEIGTDFVKYFNN